jgi:hypothetical protein
MFQGSSEEAQSCPSEAEARADSVGLNVRAQARTLHLKPVPFKSPTYAEVR